MASDIRDRTAEAAEQGTVLHGIAWKTYLKLREEAGRLGETAWKRWLRAWAVDLPEPTA